MRRTYKDTHRVVDVSMERFQSIEQSSHGYQTADDYCCTESENKS